MTLTITDTAAAREAVERGDLLQRRTLLRQAKAFGRRLPFMSKTEWEAFKAKFEADRAAFNAKTRGEKVAEP